jgi:hypothetical protein
MIKLRAGRPSNRHSIPGGDKRRLSNGFLTGPQTHLAFNSVGIECKVVAAQIAPVTLHLII